VRCTGFACVEEATHWIRRKTSTGVSLITVMCPFHTKMVEARKGTRIRRIKKRRNVA